MIVPTPSLYQELERQKEIADNAPTVRKICVPELQFAYPRVGSNGACSQAQADSKPTMKTVRKKAEVMQPLDVDEVPALLRSDDARCNDSYMARVCLAIA